jgi:alpha-ketoglutarate-dependent 2,4-dichlorophenoxyacetate dioxygenase
VANKKTWLAELKEIIARLQSRYSQGGSMKFSIKPADPARPDFAGRVIGADLRQPLRPEEVARIEAGMDRFAVLVFSDQTITNEQQIAFTRSFGELEPAFFVPGDNVQAGRIPAEINDVSNLDCNNKPLPRDDRQRLFQLGNQLWHSDSSYKLVPAKYSLLLAHAIPDRGGNTEFADMRSAWDSLDAETKALVCNMICEHSRVYSRGELGFKFTADEEKKFAPVPQRLVRRHPVSGRRSLYLSSHGGAIQGWSLPEGRALLRELTEHATQREHVYSHSWRKFDLVMWDNRVTMHRGKRYPADQPRDMRRTTTIDATSTLQQAA